MARFIQVLMSLIPRRPSSPPQARDVPTPPLASSSSRAMITTRKRKAASDDDDQHPPRKLAAISEESQPNQPLRPSKNAPNVAANRTGLARKTVGLTVPKAPAITAKTTTATTSTANGARRAQPSRATSLPPRSTAPLPRPTVRPTTRAATTRNVSGPVRGKQAEEQRFQALQAQVTSIAANMDAERTKREELEANHHALLASTKSQELSQRRELDTALDELETLKRKHANDILDWETEIKRKERQIRELEEDIRLRDEDLERERETVKTLRATVSQQATAQLTLNSQVTALQAQVTAVQIALDNSSNSAAELALKLEAAERRIAEQAQEIAEAETHRRKLHNMVQELKVYPIYIILSRLLTHHRAISECFVACDRSYPQIFHQACSRPTALPVPQLLRPKTTRRGRRCSEPRSRSRTRWTTKRLFFIHPARVPLVKSGKTNGSSRLTE